VNWRVRYLRDIAQVKGSDQEISWGESDQEISWRESEDRRQVMQNLHLPAILPLIIVGL